MKKEIKKLFIVAILLIGLTGCINNQNKLKFITLSNEKVKINEQEITMTDDDYDLFYEIVDNLNWGKNVELTTELYEYEVNSVRTLELDEGKLINQKYKEFECLYKIATISKCVILECMPVSVDSAYKEILYASIDDKELNNINAIFNNYIFDEPCLTFGKSNVNGIRYNQKYYQTNDNLFLDIVDRVNWVSVPMLDAYNNKMTITARTDTFLVDTSRVVYNTNDADFKTGIYQVKYIIDLNTNYAQAFIMSPFYVSAIYITAIYEADISEYVDEFYTYFKAIAPIHKVNVNNSLDMNYSISKKYAFLDEEITVYITKPLGFDTRTQNIVMYINDNKYEGETLNLYYYKFLMLDSDVTIRFEIVNKEKNDNLKINYYSEVVLNKNLQQSIINSYLTLFNLSSLVNNQTNDELIVEIEKCYGIYQYDDLNVIPVFIKTNFIPLDEGYWTEKINSCEISYQNSNRIYVYYNDEMYTLTKAYQTGLLDYQTIYKIVELEKQRNIKDLSLINVDETLISSTNKMNRTGGKVIKSVDEFNEYKKENDIVTSSKTCEMQMSYNDYLNDDFFKLKSLVIIPYYVQNRYEESMIFLQNGYFLDGNVMYLDLLLSNYKTSFDIVDNYISYNYISYTKYITIEVNKLDVCNIDYVFFRDPLTLMRVVSTVDSHYLVFENYDYLSKYPTDVVYTNEEIKIYLKKDMMDGVSIYVNDELYTSTYQVDEVDGQNVLSFILKVNDDSFVSFVHDSFVRKYITSYNMSYELQEEVLGKYYQKLSPNEKTSDDYAYIKKYYVKFNGYILYIVSSRDKECNMMVKQIGNYNFYNYSSQNLIVYINGEIYDLETAYLNNLISDSELKYVCKIHNKNELDYYQGNYRVITIDNTSSVSETDDKELLEKLSKGLFCDDIDSLNKLFSIFKTNSFTVLDSSIFDEYIVFVKRNYYSTQLSWTDYDSITINGTSIIIKRKINYGECDAVMSDINYVFIKKEELNNLSAVDLNKMNIQFINN